MTLGFRTAATPDQPIQPAACYTASCCLQVATKATCAIEPAMHASQLLYDRTPGSSGNFNLMSLLTDNRRNTTKPFQSLFSLAPKRLFSTMRKLKGRRTSTCSCAAGRDFDSGLPGASSCKGHKKGARYMHKLHG